VRVSSRNRRGRAGHACGTVEFDFVQPLVAFRRGVDELGQLRPDPLW
jgi:hypothetical protein